MPAYSNMLTAVGNIIWTKKFMSTNPLITISCNLTPPADESYGTLIIITDVFVSMYVWLTKL